MQGLIGRYVDCLRTRRGDHLGNQLCSQRQGDRAWHDAARFFLYTLFGALSAATALALSGKAGALFSELRALGADWVWLVVAVVSSAAGALLIYIAIGEKNATLASLIEISYPFFVAIFAWLFFRDAQFSWPTLLGGLLILGGVGVVFLGERY